MPHFDVRLVLTVSMFAGGLLYCAVNFFTKKDFSLAHLVLSILGCAATVGAANLMVLAWMPEHLVHIHDLKGEPVPLDTIKVTMSDWHFYEIVGGCIILFIFELHLLFKAVQGRNH